VERQAITNVILAMAEYGDGRLKTARELYDRAVTNMESERQSGQQTLRRAEIDQWLTYEILRREAAELMEIDNQADASDTNTDAPADD
jgi:hypothetical protein